MIIKCGLVIKSLVDNVMNLWYFDTPVLGVMWRASAGAGPATLSTAFRSLSPHRLSWLLSACLFIYTVYERISACVYIRSSMHVWNIIVCVLMYTNAINYWFYERFVQCFLNFCFVFFYVCFHLFIFNVMQMSSASHGHSFYFSLQFFFSNVLQCCTWIYM